LRHSTSVSQPPIAEHRIDWHGASSSGRQRPVDKPHDDDDVNSRSRSLYGIARPSVVCLSSVCNARARYSGGSNFRQYFYGIRYLGHSLTSTENFTEIDRPRGTPPPGELNTRGVAKYSDFGPMGGYISETVQDMK